MEVIHRMEDELQMLRMNARIDAFEETEQEWPNTRENERLDLVGKFSSSAKFRKRLKQKKDPLFSI